MSQVRWHYERLVYQETSTLMFFFEGASADVVASTLRGEDDEGNDRTERFVKGDEVELRLDFIYCRPSNSPSLDEPGWPPEEFGGLHLDHDTCKTVHEGSILDHAIDADDFAGKINDFGGDDFYGTGLVRRLPPQNGEPGEIRFEVHADTATGIVAQLLNRRSLTDFLTFQIFSQIAPDSFSLAPLRVIGTEADQPGVSSEDAQARRLADRFEPPTISKACLAEEEFVELLKNPHARISYRQLYQVIPCKPQTMKEYLVNARLAEKGVRLTAQTFAVSELVSDLVPHLQRGKSLGNKVFRLLNLFENAGHISQYRID